MRVIHRHGLASLALSVILAVALGSPLGNRQARADIGYIYDGAGRLVGVVDPTGDTVQYAYDAVGNLLSIARHPSTATSIIEFNPTGGPAGSNVTIWGTGFDVSLGNNTVRINGALAEIAAAASTELIVTVPDGATSGPIEVTTPSGVATSSRPFTVGSSVPAITGFTPTIGGPETIVSVIGTNFDPIPTNDKLRFNTGAAAATTATGTSLSVAVPPAATSGRITLATPTGAATSVADFFVPPPPYSAASVDVTGRLTIGESRVVTLSAQDKIGLLVFDATAGQRMSLGLSLPTGAGACVDVRQPNGTILTTVLTPGEFDSAPLAVTGTYTLVSRNCSAQSGGSFTLAVSTDISGQIVPDGPGVPVTVNLLGQNVRLTFPGTAGQRVGVATVNGSFSCCTIYNLLTPDGTPLANWPCTQCGPSNDIDATLPVTGTYTVLINPRLGTGTATVYVSTPVSGSIAINGPPVSVRLRPGQDASLLFSGAANQHVRLTDSNTTFGAIYSIVDPNGNSLGNVCAGCGGRVDVVLPVDGTYRVAVDGGLASGSLTLTLVQLP